MCLIIHYIHNLDLATHNKMKQSIPSEVIQDICHYLNPDRLHKLASHSTEARYVVNGMERARYIEKWLDTAGTMELMYDYGYKLTNDNLKYELENYWYLCLLDDYVPNKNLLIILDGIKKKNLSISMQRTSTGYVSALSKVHTLYLSGCNELTDVSALGGVHKLLLHLCHNIIDISGLANVNYLLLSYCNKIKDINMLGNVHTLVVSCCSGIQDISGLTSVYNINLGGVTITNMNDFRNARRVSISGCRGVKDIDMLANIYELELSSFSNTYILDINKLVGVYNLYIESIIDVNDIINIDALGSLNKISVSRVWVKKVDMLGSVKKIHLSSIYLK